ncbi:MAG TPA: GAF domain-containing protein [Mucilaginibacter sp.]|nr:GAF domain-containing protein [Mucilaginibacter sp.]
MQIGLSYIPESKRINDLIDTKISFRPFIAYLEEHIKTEKTVKAKFYEYVLQQFRDEPACTSNINIDDINKYSRHLELIYSILTPVTVDEENYFWALSSPLSKKIFYGTDAYINLVNSVNSVELEPGTQDESKNKINQRFKNFIYKLILGKFYGVNSINSEKIVYAYHEPQTGLHKYYRIEPDTRFIDIKAKTPLPALDFDALNLCITEGCVTDGLDTLLPLSNFYLEGFTVVTMEDITDEYAIDIIKRSLLQHSDDHDQLYDEVKNALRTLGGNKDVEFGLLPFLAVNNRLVFDDIECSRSIIVRSARTTEGGMQKIYESANAYIKNPVMRMYPVITDELQQENPHLIALKAMGVQSYSVIPVFYNQRMVGVLEVYSYQEILHFEYLLSRLADAMPLIAQLLQNSIDQFNQRIDDVIKEKFTTLQSSVQWKFNEVALEYLRQPSNEEKETPIGTVTFKNVYPLFGAVDIRNSTIERNQALNEDIDNLLALLVLGKEQIGKLLPKKVAADMAREFALWYKKIDTFLKLSDSGMLNAFLQSDVVPYLIQLLVDHPAAEEPIRRLRKIIEDDAEEVSGKRAALEKSIQGINMALNTFFEKGRKKVKAIYPCYFETFRTDGVEYDLYTGQSIKPAVEFTREHLQAFRLWQLRSMCEVVRITEELVSSMPRPLQTTQLIYVNPHAINISFRNDERHFDVDGAYNIRYQIIKKRIDKVHIKDSFERLTQPGQIAIVYFNDEDAEEYAGYIKTCQDEGLLYDDYETLELEELQGVSGLKAIRVSVKIA